MEKTISDRFLKTEKVRTRKRLRRCLSQRKVKLIRTFTTKLVQKVDRIANDFRDDGDILITFGEH